MKQTCLISLLALSCSLALTACHPEDEKNIPAQKVNQQLSNNMEQSIVLDSQNMMAHVKQFQAIAQQNGGNRALGSKGDQASAAYILAQVKKAGYPVQIFDFKNQQHVAGQNILVKIPGQQNASIIVGAHYDSTKIGPGLNDDASGVSLLLELMHQLSTAKFKPQQTIYLAFWDAGETDRAGSQAYVSQLTPEELKNIQAYINVDMVGTKNPTVLMASADTSPASVAQIAKILRNKGMQKEVKDEDRLLADEVNALPKNPSDLALQQSLKAFFQSQNLDMKEDVYGLTTSDGASFVGKVPVTSLILFDKNGDARKFSPCHEPACDQLDQIDPNSLALAGRTVLHLIQNINQPQ